MRLSAKLTKAMVVLTLALLLATLVVGSPVLLGISLASLVITWARMHLTDWSA